MDYEHRLAVDGRYRRYLIHTPTPTPQFAPAFLHFHGGGGNAVDAQRQTQFNVTADKHKVYSVFLEGTAPQNYSLYTWNSGNCCGYAVRENVDDIAYTMAVINDLRTRYDIKSVFLTGFSNGAMMAYRCALEISQHIVGICAIAGTMNINLPIPPDGGCPILHIHGYDDPNAPLLGGYATNPLASSRIIHAPVGSCMGWWVRANKCYPTTPREEPWYRHYKWRSRSPNGKPVECYLLNNGGHTWPGGIDVTPNAGTGRLVNFPANETIIRFYNDLVT